MRGTDLYAPSLLDKLLGGDSSVSDGTVLRFSVEQMKDSVARDIEALLNAHQAFSAEELRALPQASRSLLTLGLLDISSMSLASDKDRKRITDAIRDGLLTHERRLSQIEVGVRQVGGAVGSVTFTIRGKLMLKPNTEQVVFDAILQPGSKRYNVSKADRRDTTL